MLLVMKIEKLDPQAFLDMEENKDITITGRGENIYFKDDYLKELEEKAQKYDDLINLGEVISESIFSSVGEAKAKEKSIEILKDFSKLGFLGHDIKPRESF
jgi:hypothetical protein